MSIVNVNQIQPVGSGQTVTINAANISAGSATVTAGTFSGGVAVTSGNLTGITSVSTTNLTVNGNAYPSTGPLSNRNLIINGDMKVSQRGTSTTGLTGNYNDYTTLDRYRFENYNDGGTNTSVWSMEQSTDAPSGFSNSLKLTATTADADYGSGSSQTNVNTRLEAQNLQHLKYGTASAENLTLSFWVKSSVTGTYLIWFYQDDDGRHCTKTYTINAANTWEYKTVTISGDTTGVIDNDNGLGLHVRWLLATGSIFTSGTYLDGSWANFTNGDTYAGHAVNVASSTNNTFYLTGAQLELGSVATEFEHRSYGDELALCQRYFFNPLQNTNNSRSTYPISYVTAGASNGWTVFQVPFPVAMRIPPTLSHNISDSNFLQNSPSSTQWAFYRQNQAYPGKQGGQNMSVLNASSNTTQANVGAYYVSPSSEASAILFGSELTFHFNAEL